MVNLKVSETKTIIGGGLSITGTLINAFRSSISAIFEVGQAVGGAIRRITSSNLCKF